MDITPVGGWFSFDPKEAIEYFRVALRRDFPDAGIERYESEGLAGWVIVLPPQRTYTYGQVEAAALTLQEDLFWKKDALVLYMIVRDTEELDE